MQYFGRKKDINVPRTLKKRRKNEKIAKNTPKNEKSFEKGIDKTISCVILDEYEKNRYYRKEFNYVYNNVEKRGR